MSKRVLLLLTVLTTLTFSLSALAVDSDLTPEGAEGISNEAGTSISNEVNDDQRTDDIVGAPNEIGASVPEAGMSVPEIGASIPGEENNENHPADGGALQSTQQTTPDTDVTLFAVGTAPYENYTYNVNPDNISVTITKYTGSAYRVTVPAELDGKTVTHIGNGAFEGVGRNNTTSQGGTVIVVIQSGVTHIGDKAFYNCAQLEQVYLPSTLTNIGNEAFANTKLNSVYFRGDAPVAGTDGFKNTGSGFSIYYSADNIGWSSPLWNGYAAEGIGTFGDFKYALRGSSIAITGYVGDGGAVVIPSSVDGDPVTAIADFAFDKCETITSVVVPEGVKAIGKYAFHRCYGMKSVTLPTSLEGIGLAAFGFCTALDNVTVPGGVENLSDTAFYSCSNLKSVNISEGVKSTGAASFFNCTSLTDVALPSSLLRINTSAFGGCKSLTKINLGGNETTIDDFAFALTNLETITIHPRVTTILDGAFAECLNLKNAYFEGKAPTTFKNLVFYKTKPNKDVDAIIIPRFELYYPSNALGWISPQWNKYEAFSYEPVSNYYVYTAYGLPEGLNVDINTGAITGRCTDAPGDYNVYVALRDRMKLQSLLLSEFTISVR